MASKKTIKLILYFSILIITIACEPPKDYSKIRAQLNDIFVKDQLYRSNLDSDNYGIIMETDKANLKVVTKIIDSLGWLGKSEIGDSANSALFLVIQHSDIVTMEKYFPILKKAVAEKKAEKQDLALLTDRIEIYKGRLQIYGSQLKKVNDTFTFKNVIDVKNLDRRRAEMDMPPIAVYLKVVNSLRW